MANQTTLAKGGSTVPVATQTLTRWDHEIDIADAAGTVTTGGYTVVLNIPADTYVTLEQVEVVTALDLDSGASDRVDIGDSADDDEWVSNATTLTAGTNLTLLKVNGTPGNVYTAADTIRLKLTGDKLAGGTANATGKLRFVGTIMSTARNAMAATFTP
jgi:hypothetical protein